MGERRADFSIDADAARALVAEHAARRSCSCAARTTRPAPSSRPRPSTALLDATDGPASSSTRRTASSRRGARSSSSTTTRPLVVVRTYSKVWSLAALRLGFAVAPPWVVEELEKVVLPYHLVGAHADRRAARARVRRRDGRPRRARWSRSASALLAALADDRRRHACSRRARTSCCSASHGDGHDAVAAARRPRRARARLLALAPRSRSASASPSARPTRTTRSSPRSTQSLREVAA